MARKIKPRDVAAQLEHDIYSLRNFAGEILEDANDHQVALALFALEQDDVDLAIEFLKIEKKVRDEGGLTEDVYEDHRRLVNRLAEYDKP